MKLAKSQQSLSPEQSGFFLNTLNRMWNGTTSLNYVRHDDDYKRLLNILIAHENAEIQRHNDAFRFDVMDKIEP
jgi:hypothetical protein